LHFQIYQAHKWRVERFPAKLTESDDRLSSDPFIVGPLRCSLSLGKKTEEAKEDSPAVDWLSVGFRYEGVKVKDKDHVKITLFNSAELTIESQLQSIV
jgi:hypothetical protein